MREPEPVQIMVDDTFSEQQSSNSNSSFETAVSPPSDTPLRFEVVRDTIACTGAALIELADGMESTASSSTDPFSSDVRDERNPTASGTTDFSELIEPACRTTDDNYQAAETDFGLDRPRTPQLQPEIFNQVSMGPMTTSDVPDLESGNSTAMATAQVNFVPAENDVLPDEDFDLTDFAILPDVVDPVPVLLREQGTLLHDPILLSAEAADDVEIPGSQVDAPAEVKHNNEDTETGGEDSIDAPTKPEGEARTSGDAAATKGAFDAQPKRSNDVAIGAFQLQRLMGEGTSQFAESRTQNYVHAVLVKLLANFASAIQGSPDLFTTDQLSKALLHYGIDHIELGLSGVFLAVEDDISILSESLQTQVDKMLKTYVLSIFPSRGGAGGGSDPKDAQVDDFSWLVRVEGILNVLSDLRSWHEPTRVRISCIENHFANGFLLASGTELKPTAFRLTDKDRELLASAHANDSFSTGVEVWVADGLELFYLLLYSFLNSQRNTGSGSTTKMNYCRTRVERVQAAVQKTISLDVTVWRKLEFVYSEIEEYPTIVRVKELMDSFLRGQKTHAKALESCVFFPTLVAFASRKAKQISQSLAEFIQQEQQTAPSTSSEPLSASAAIQRCLISFQTRMEAAQVNASAPLEGYLRNVGLRTVDMDGINKARSARGLTRISLSGKHSLSTHHQSELLGSDYALHLRPRWNHARLKRSHMNPYVFHGDASIAVEAVYIRRRIALDELQEMSWDDVERYAEGDVREAYKMLSSGICEQSGNVLLAIGVNALHLRVLANGVSSLHTVVTGLPGAQAISLGYFVSRDDDIAAVRVVFRVHVDPASAFQDQNREDMSRVAASGVVSVFETLQHIIESGDEKTLTRALEFNCLSFLFGCLEGNRRHQWQDVAFGGSFYDDIDGAQAGVHYHVEGVLRSMSALIEQIPLALFAITKRNLQVLTSLVVDIHDTVAVETSLFTTVVKVLRRLCSPTLKPASGAAKVDSFSELQHKFAAEDGLKLLVNAAELLAVSSASRQLVVEEMILSLLKSAELCASRGALLVHWRHWMAYFVENGACMSTRSNAEFLALLMQGIHEHVFVPLTDHNWDPGAVTTATCGCGCNESVVISLKNVSGVMKLFLSLLVKDRGVLWGQENMKGPIDCLIFYTWTASGESGAQRNANTWQQLRLNIFDALCVFLERMTSADRYLLFLNATTPKLLKFLLEAKSNELQKALLRTLSLALELSIERSVYKVSMPKFLVSLYDILQAFCPASASQSTMNTLMVDTLFQRDSSQPWTASTQLQSTETNVLELIHEEHSDLQQARTGNVSTRRKSLLESLFRLLTLPPESPLQPFCQSPVLICFGWLVNSATIAGDCVTLGLVRVVLDLVEGDAVSSCILAARVLSVVMFQLMTKKDALDVNSYLRLGNALTVVLSAGARMSMAQHHGSSGDTDSLRFSADQADSRLILARYAAVNATQHAVESKGGMIDATSFQEGVWEAHEWRDQERAVQSKLVVMLNVLVVFSSLTDAVRLVQGSAELKHIQFQIWVRLLE